MNDGSEFEMRDQYDFRGARPSRLYTPMTREETAAALRRAACGDAKAWDRITGERVRAAEQAIIAHWTLVRYDGVDPGGAVWTDAPEYDEIIEDRAWMCSDEFFQKATLTREEVERMREIQARVDALANRLNRAVDEHLKAQGYTEEEIADRREAALYGRRTVARA
jgi:hypothetical protein